MGRFREGDLVKAKHLIRFLHGGKTLSEIKQDTYGVVKRISKGRSVSVKFIGHRLCSVSESEIERANPLDKMAWDFGDMNEHAVDEQGEA